MRTWKKGIQSETVGKEGMAEGKKKDQNHHFSHLWGRAQREFKRLTGTKANSEESRESKHSFKCSVRISGGGKKVKVGVKEPR